MDIDYNKLQDFPQNPAVYISNQPYASRNN